MALGAVTQVAIDPHSSQTSPVVFGDLKVSVTNVVGDSSYPTGGTALAASSLGLTTVLFAITQIIATSGSNNTADSAYYNTATGKLQTFASADSAGNPLSETANTTNVSGLTVQIIAFGY